MPWATTNPITIWAVMFIPVFVLLWIFPPKAKLTSFLVLLDFIAANLFWILTANWAVINYWLRLLPILLIILLSIRLWRAGQPRFDHRLEKIITAPLVPAKKSIAMNALIASAVVFVALLPVNFMLLRSLSHNSSSGEPLMLLYPLRYGMYVVVNGGNGLEGLGMNDAYQDWLGRKTGDRSQIYAVDLMKMADNRGRTSQGVLPTSLQRYDGYRDLVFAPCNGSIVYVEDGHSDRALGAAETSLGNRVVIQCREYFVTLANLKKESILVKVGDRVNFQDQVGMLGSSGMPSIPHLRIFTTLGSWDEQGTPVPMLFDTASRFLVRNDLILPGY